MYFFHKIHYTPFVLFSLTITTRSSENAVTGRVPVILEKLQFLKFFSIFFSTFHVFFSVEFIFITRFVFSENYCIFIQVRLQTLAILLLRSTTTGYYGKKKKN